MEKSDSDFDEVLKSHNTRAKIHRLRIPEPQTGSGRGTFIEVEVWRPVGSFLVILDHEEVTHYGKCGALDRCLREIS